MKYDVSNLAIRNLGVLIILSIIFLETPLKAEVKKFSLLTALTTQSNLYQTNDPDYAASMGVEIRPQFLLSKNTTMNFSLDWEQELYDEQKSHINDGYAGISRKLDLGESSKILSSNLNFRLYLPMNEEAQSNSSFITRLYLSPSFSLDMSELLLSGLSIKYIPFISKDFYKYETSLTGASNTEYTMGQILVFGFSPHERISFDVLFLYNRSWSFEGSRKGDVFRIGEDITYSFPTYVDISIGHVNEGSALEADGISSNVSAYNENSSSVYLTLSKQF